MAQVIELLGDFPLEVKMGGKYSRELFDHTGSCPFGCFGCRKHYIRSLTGALRYIKTLKPWPLKRVMVDKYLYTEAESAALCDFMEPMLSVDFRARINARDMKHHKWLEVNPDDGIVTDW